MAGGGAGSGTAEPAPVAAPAPPAAAPAGAAPAGAVPATAAAAAAGSSSLIVPAAERELVLEEIAAVAGALHDPRARAPYQELAAAVAAGEVPGTLAGTLQKVLEMSLSTGRARRLHGAQHEAALLRLFFQAPAGQALRRSAEVANRALAALAGQRLDALSIAAQAPGVFRLQLDTDRCQLTLEVSRDGVEVASLGVEI